MEKLPTIFVSIGTPVTKEQLEFKEAIKASIESLGFAPRMVGKRDEDTDHPHIRPFDHIVTILKRCEGVVVVAYEKDNADRLVRQSLEDPPKTSKGIRLTTAWNHAEAGIAYALGLPILILCEKGIKQEGMIEYGVLANVIDVELTAGQTKTATFKSYLENWANDVRTKKGSTPLVAGGIETISLAELWSLLVRLKISTIVAIVTGMLALAGAAYWIGQLVGSLHK